MTIYENLDENITWRKRVLGFPCKIFHYYIQHELGSFSHQVYFGSSF